MVVAFRSKARYKLTRNDGSTTYVTNQDSFSEMQRWKNAYNKNADEPKYRQIAKIERRTKPDLYNVRRDGPLRVTVYGHSPKRASRVSSNPFGLPVVGLPFASKKKGKGSNIFGGW